tara:strand:- start:10 stop:252 length:243 start_codon:yes stop_codon:yes gene_type:complete
MNGNDKVTKITLIAIAIGIWAIVFQNATAKQDVYVKGGYVNADVSGEVEVSGSVDVDNTVSVSIDEVLDRDGKKYYYNNN